MFRGFAAPSMALSAVLLAPQRTQVEVKNYIGHIFWSHARSHSK